MKRKKMKTINKSTKVTQYFAKILVASTVALAFVACGDDSSSASDEEVEQTRSSTYVFGTDFASGELRWVEDGKLSEESLEFFQDAKIVTVDSSILVLEGAGADNVSLVNSKHKVVWQVSLDDYSNPRDAVVLDGYAWIALEGVDKFVQISLKDGSVHKTVKTGAFNRKGASSPNLIDFEVLGDTLFALFQRYVYDAATYSSKFSRGLLAMYSSKGELLDTIQLLNKNPVAVKKAKKNLYVFSQGEYNDSWGTDADDKRGIEKVDISKKKSKLLVGGEKLGGGVYSAAVDEENEIAFVAVYKSYGDVPVMEVDLEKGSAEKLEGVSDVEGSLGFNEGKLYVGERAIGAEGVYVYDGDEMTKLESDAPDALPPYGFTFSF